MDVFRTNFQIAVQLHVSGRRGCCTPLAYEPFFRLYRFIDNDVPIKRKREKMIATARAVFLFDAGSYRGLGWNGIWEMMAGENE